MEQWAGRFVAQLATSSAVLTTSSSGISLRDTATGSQARTEADGPTWTVRQHGRPGSGTRSKKLFEPGRPQGHRICRSSR